MKRLFRIVPILFIGILALLPLRAAALQVQDVGPLVGLGTADLTTVVMRLISTALGLLGILAVIMILLGGFRWMLSAGDEERIASAKRSLSATVIGLIIILLAWAIVNFVINTTANVSGGGP